MQQNNNTTLKKKKKKLFKKIPINASPSHPLYDPLNR